MTANTHNRYAAKCGEILWRVELPIPVDVQFHPHWGSLLEGFPVELVYSLVTLEPDVSDMIARAVYRPNLSTFVEDEEKREIRYDPALPGNYYVVVVWDKTNRRWQTTKYEGNRLVAQATGCNFRDAMIQTLLIGIQPDEPAV